MLVVMLSDQTGSVRSVHFHIWPDRTCIKCSLGSVCSIHSHVVRGNRSCMQCSFSCCQRKQELYAVFIFMLSEETEAVCSVNFHV